MKKLLAQIISAGLGLWLATIFVFGVKVFVLPDSNFFGIPLQASWELFVLFGLLLGLLNYFIKPILNTIALPLRIITLGLFSLVINMGLIWVVDYLFKEFRIPLVFPLVLTALIIWGLNLLLTKLVLRSDD